MTLTLSTARRNTGVDAMLADLSGGRLVIRTAGKAVLATVPLATPAYAPAVDGTAALRPVGEVTATAAGVAAEAVLITARGEEAISGDVTLSDEAGFIKITASSLSIAVNQVFRVDALPLTLPAGA
ncbi:hypothetical protein [Falsirhodobacter halotolerans]|uniref:hypothetical protein n=1 Tax=Falsirhodobacter halotolerans TaxID=1146892 RepID=UPI001FD37E27|nr:hypothetical protein [Falsirhodobacter halotolerans]MCJ8138616.1 hypothetical protein [Falsirhodobacter halotolerans]